MEAADFTQCATHGSFSRRWQETLYNMFHFITLYVLPLLVMSCCYSRILLHIHLQHLRDKGKGGWVGGCRQLRTRPRCVGCSSAEREAAGLTGCFVSMETTGGHGCRQAQVCVMTSLTDTVGLSAGESYLRRSGTDIIPKARLKTLKMTLVIVLSFVVCWTPYYLLGVWYWFQPDMLRVTPEYVHHALFVFGNLNTCCDPLIYGFYTPSFRADLAACFRQRRIKASARRAGEERTNQ